MFQFKEERKVYKATKPTFRFRYFEVVSSEILEQIELMEKLRDEVVLKVRSLCRQLGANDFYIEGVRGKVVGVHFSENNPLNPEKNIIQREGWKKTQKGWMPKLSTKKGQDLAKKMDGWPVIPHIAEPLERAFGFEFYKPLISQGKNKLSISVVRKRCLNQGVKVFVYVPWVFHNDYTREVYECNEGLAQENAFLNGFKISDCVKELSPSEYNALNGVNKINAFMKLNEQEKAKKNKRKRLDKRRRKRK